MADGFEFVIDKEQPMPTREQAFLDHLRLLFWAFDIGVCEGCIYSNRKRPQKCACCRRNPDMKDCYEEASNG